MKTGNGKMAVTVSLAAVLFFASVSVHAESKFLGPGDAFGIKSWWHLQITGESWLSEQFDGAKSMTEHGWSFYNRDSAMVMINMLINIIQKDKSPFSVDAWEDKKLINKKETWPIVVMLQLIDNGTIRVGIQDRTTGRSEMWNFK